MGGCVGAGVGVFGLTFDSVTDIEGGHCIAYCPLLVAYYFYIFPHRTILPRNTINL